MIRFEWKYNGRVWYACQFPDGQIEVYNGEEHARYAVETLCAVMRGMRANALGQGHAGLRCVWPDGRPAWAREAGL